MAKKIFLTKGTDHLLPITRGELVVDSSGKQAFRSEDFLVDVDNNLPGLISVEDKLRIDDMIAESIRNPFLLTFQGKEATQKQEYVYNGSNSLNVEIKTGDNIYFSIGDHKVAINALNDKVTQIDLSADVDNTLLTSVYDILLGSSMITDGNVTDFVYKDSGSLQYDILQNTLYVDYINAKVATNGSSIGSPTTPIYIDEQGRYTASSADVGHSNLPVYLKKGELKPVVINDSTNPLYILGLSSDGTMYTGIKSTQGVRIVSGNSLYASGGFYESSDESLKNFRKDISVDLEQLQEIPKKYFTWKEGNTEELQIGTSAQALSVLYPELVKQDSDGINHVAYDKLSIIALKAIDELYALVKQLQQANQQMQKRIEYLEHNY